MIFSSIALLALAPIHSVALKADLPLMMQHPTMNKTSIVFAFGGDLWIVPRVGGDAVRITRGEGSEASPVFSPDGNTIAFTGTYDGNPDVYIVPAKGGTPKRLTYNPDADQVMSWTRDGQNVLFNSTLGGFSGVPRLFTVSIKGGLPNDLPFPEGTDGSYSPDGTRIAYVPKTIWQEAWKRYRGGQTRPIWIAKLSDSSWFEIPRKNSNDTTPMWIGEKVFFLSDRVGPVSLFVYDTNTKKVTQCLKNDGFDFKSASAGPDAIVYEQFGGIHTYDWSSGKSEKISISIQGDFLETRKRIREVSDYISVARISPNGVRAVMEARGDIFTAPTDKGDVRNLTDTSNAADRDPSWSPDGKWIAYFSDRSGEYELMIQSSDGRGETKVLKPGESPSYYYMPVWSPDSKKIAYTDKRLNIWYTEVETGKNVKVDTSAVENPFRDTYPSWSPDSKWLTWSRNLQTRIQAVFVHSIDTGKTTKLTDGLSDARYPVFDLSGKYLYFVASTESGRGSSWLDMTSFDANNARFSAYLVVLRKDLPSPLLPESNEEDTEQTSEAGAPDKTVRIDFEGVSQRILALPMPMQRFLGTGAGTAGQLFLLSMGPSAAIGLPGQVTVWKFDLKKRSAAPFAQGVQSFDISPNGQHILIQSPGGFSIGSTVAPSAAGAAPVSTDRMESSIDPREEWRQMYNETWRTQRDFMYAPNHHGINIEEMRKRYAPFVETCMSREDLNYLFTEMLGETSLGHTFVGGGDIPGSDGAPTGLLGADFEFVGGRYRIKNVLNGESWNPNLRAPLTQPGVNAKPGEYLISVNGKNLTDQDNIYAFFEGLAGKQVRLKLAGTSDGTGAREVIVVPSGSENGLRTIAWVENNRRIVDKLSNGKVGYVWLPDTGLGGFTFFNRYYYAQTDKEGLVADERFNGGGTAADYLVEFMTRPLRAGISTREGMDFYSPGASIYGPKAMIINEYAGSGGDYLPWLFKTSGVGPLIGKRTWGGLVGIYDYPQLIDGGSVTAPRVGFWTADGKWLIENEGVAPDYEVEMDPFLWRQGRDPQLEKAVAVVMEQMKAKPWKRPTRPPYPNKSRLPGGGGLYDNQLNAFKL